MLGEVCEEAESKVRQEVIDMVLEHVLHLEAARKCFFSWTSSENLKPLYLEGIDLAAKWQEMGSACQDTFCGGLQTMARRFVPTAPARH